MVKTSDFVKFLEENGARVYNYKSEGIYKAFWKKAYVGFDNAPNLGEIILRGKTPDFGMLKALVLRFFEERGIQTYYDEAHDIISMKPFKTYTEEEVLDLFREVYG